MPKTEAAKKVLGDEIGMALDCGPGCVPKDAIRFARVVEPYKLAWLEDITGDYTPYPNAQVFKEAKDSTTTPIHTGEEIYLRENFKDLVEMQAVDVVGPDPEDVGGITELKWIREYADLHGILDGILDGLPNPIVKDGFIGVWDKPGLGITFNVGAANAHLRDEDAISLIEGHL